MWCGGTGIRAASNLSIEATPERRAEPLYDCHAIFGNDPFITKPAKPPPMAGENRKFYSCGNEVMKAP